MGGAGWAARENTLATNKPPKEWQPCVPSQLITVNKSRGGSKSTVYKCQFRYILYRFVRLNIYLEAVASRMEFEM